MNTDFVALLIPITAIVSIAVIIIYLRRYANQERLAMIDRGIDIYKDMPKKRQSYETLKGGLFFIGIGLGFLFGHILEANTEMRELAYFVMLFIFGGIGLTVSHLVVQRQLKKEENKL